MPHPVGKATVEGHGGRRAARARGTTVTTPSTSERLTGAATRSPWLMLAMATIGFAVNFWAWALISPLGPLFRDTGRSARSASPTSPCSSRCR